MSAPTFTVILCHYNDSRYLAGALEGVLDQETPPDQVIVVDDGSDPAERDAFDAVVARYPGLDVIRHESNRGVVAAGRLALEITRGDYVAWWSVDDRIAPGLLRAARAASVACPGAGVIATETRVEDEGPDGPVPAYTHSFGLGQERMHLTGPQFAAVQRHRYVWLCSSGAFLKRECLEVGIGWNQSLDWFSDWAALYAAAYRDGVVLIGQILSTTTRRRDSFGARARADRARSRNAVVAFLELISRPENRDIRRALLTGPLALSYALGAAFYKASILRVGDWPLAVRTAYCAISHRILVRRTGCVSEVSMLVEAGVLNDDAA